MIGIIDGTKNNRLLRYSFLITSKDNTTLELKNFTKIMTWTEILAPIKNTEYFETLWQKVKNEYATTKCFPPKNQIFRGVQTCLLLLLSIEKQISI